MSKRLKSKTVLDGSKLCFDLAKVTVSNGLVLGLQLFLLVAASAQGATAPALTSQWCCE